MDNRSLTLRMFLLLAMAGFACSGEPLEGETQNAIQWPLPQPDPNACLQDASQRISAKANAAGAVLGNSTQLFPQTVSACSLYLRRYQYGTVYYVYGQRDAYEVHGDIGVKYRFFGEFNSQLGAPTTDETADGTGGRFNHFQHGSIYWKPNLGARLIWGQIHDTWMSQGAQTNPSLGYPIWDEASVGGGDFMVSFENGALYYRASTNDVLTLNGVTEGFSASAVNQMVQNAIASQLPSLAWINSVTLTSVSDYTRNGDYAWPHNRRFTYDVSAGLPGAGIDLTIELELDLNRAKQEVDYTLLYWNASVTGVPGEINYVLGKLSDSLNKIVNVPQSASAVPAFVEDVKPMTDGSVQVFIQPLFHF